MRTIARLIELPNHQQFQKNVGTMRILVFGLGILLVFTIMSVTNFFPSLILGKWESETQEFDTLQMDPLVFEYTQKDVVPALHQSFMLHNNILCAVLAEQQKKSSTELPSPPDFPVRISFQMNCEQLYSSNRFGTGNVLRVFYNIRLVARVIGNVQVKFQCGDAMSTESSLVFPWIMGTFAPSRSVDSTQTVSLKDICDRFQPRTAHIIVDDIKYELRRMALSLVRIPHVNHPATRFVVEDSREKELQVPMTVSPLFPDVEIDDVAIHFRCGDIIEKRSHPKYGYVRWTALAKLISSEARTIGIITQPFTGQTRNVDRSNNKRCPSLVQEFQKYLNKRFPRAKVSLRNSPDESVALAFTRLIMANQSLAAGVSTFYTMPFYAAFGATYDVTEHVERNDMISSDTLMKLWKRKNGLQAIVKLFTN